MLSPVKELCSTKDAAAANDQQLSAELSTVSSISICILIFFSYGRVWSSISVCIQIEAMGG